MKPLNTGIRVSLLQYFWVFAVSGVLPDLFAVGCWLPAVQHNSTQLESSWGHLSGD
jgi:hypothetical protein